MSWKYRIDSWFAFSHFLGQTKSVSAADGPVELMTNDMHPYVFLKVKSTVGKLSHLKITP